MGTNYDASSPVGKIRCWIKYHGAFDFVWSGEPALAPDVKDNPRPPMR